MGKKKSLPAPRRIYGTAHSRRCAEQKNNIIIIVVVVVIIVVVAHNVPVTHHPLEAFCSENGTHF
jgi:hypothetical protein